jgi:predicted Rossmann-fold nucleotide-binding protein
VLRDRGRTIAVETLEEFDDRMGRGARSLAGWHLQGLDLRERGDQLRRVDVTGGLFLGCRLPAGAADDLAGRGALVFPSVPDVPVDQYRGSLYTPQELYAGLDDCYEATLDARVFAWSKQKGSAELSLAKALHDHAIDSALGTFVRGRRLVGVMGGHALERGSGEYADAARLGHRLANAGLVVCTGGGPGAMEAANLGAYLADRPLADLEAAIEVLAKAPGFSPSVGDWASAAFEVIRRWPEGRESLGIPTWHYGHEPPNPFATRIAKYFKNATREDILLHVCAAGIVFLPGAGGTVQEIFQDGCENYYADPATVAPMVLVGRQHWTVDVPAWPLLEALARGRSMEPVVHLVDDVDEVLERLTRS